MMEYRGLEYAIVEGIGRHMWKWTTWAGGAVVTGQAHIKQAAVVAAEKAIDRALAIKNGATCPTRATQRIMRTMTSHCSENDLAGS
jgi:hypothetical protein